MGFSLSYNTLEDRQISESRKSESMSADGDLKVVSEQILPV